MAHPLMPKATAVWLVENTALTFEQIADFCGLHALEVQAIADGDVAMGMQGLDPIANGEVTQEELDRCAGDPTTRLNPATPRVDMPKKKTPRYTPVSKRGDRPDGIAWLLKNYPELTDAQISKLVGTTKPTINAVRDKSHWNTPNIKAQNPVGLGLCAAADLEKAVDIARAKSGTVHVAKAPEPAAMVAAPEPDARTMPAPDAESVFGPSEPVEKEPEEDAPTAESVFGPAPDDTAS